MLHLSVSCFRDTLSDSTGARPGRQRMGLSVPGGPAEGARWGREMWGTWRPRSCIRGRGPAHAALLDGHAMGRPDKSLVSDKFLWIVSYGWGAAFKRAAGAERPDASASLCESVMILG
jgi:hypothetical protein